MIAWLWAFLFTQAVEVPIYARALRGNRWRVAIALGASTVTHPIVWFVIPRVWELLYLALIDWSPAFQVRSALLRYVWMIVLCETFAVVVEAIYLRLFGLRRAFAWSLLANGTSVTLGLLSRAAFGWP